jgi:hypothetical protein
MVIYHNVMILEVLVLETRIVNSETIKMVLH